MRLSNSATQEILRFSNSPIIQFCNSQILKFLEMVPFSNSTHHLQKQTVCLKRIRWSLGHRHLWQLITQTRFPTTTMMIALVKTPNCCISTGFVKIILSKRFPSSQTTHCRSFRCQNQSWISQKVNCSRVSVG